MLACYPRETDYLDGTMAPGNIAVFSNVGGGGRSSRWIILHPWTDDEIDTFLHLLGCIVSRVEYEGSIIHLAESEEEIGREIWKTISALSNFKLRLDTVE